MIPLDKITARKNGLQSRSLLSQEERERKSAAIAEEAIRRIHPEDTVGCYVSMKDEVSTEEIIQYCLSEDIAVCAPAVEGSTLIFRRITRDTVWKKSRYGVSEPQDGRIISPSDITVMIVPLSSFDAEGNRTGYGKGYYDSVLAACRKKIGIAFAEQKSESIDSDPWDIPLDEVISA